MIEAMQGGVSTGRLARTLIAVIFILNLAACTAGNSSAPADATPTPLPDEFHADAVSKRTLWRSQSIPSYRIHFEFIEDMRRPVVTQRDVFIGNFAIRGARCAPGACPTSIFKDMLTVNDVFSFMQDIPESCIDQVHYDRYLFYPAYLSASCADGIDHPFALRIVSLRAVY